MLANDRAGDCVEAGAYHETMLWNAERGKTIAVTDEVVIETYSKLTGYDPSQTDPNTGQNPTDLGTVVSDMAEYRRTTGITDAQGGVHKIGAYLSVNKGDLTLLGAAMYLFSAVGIGIELPVSAQEQFRAGQPWTVTDSQIEGGHYVPGVGRDGAGNIVVVTWGAIQQMTPAFYQRYNDETLVYLSEEFLTSGKSPEGFDLQQLRADLSALGH
jgi:hypothetical protein